MRYMPNRVTSISSKNSPRRMLASSESIHLTACKNTMKVPMLSIDFTHEMTGEVSYMPPNAVPVQLQKQP